MKYLLVSIVIGLAGCQSTPAPNVLPAPTKPVAAIHPVPIVPVAVPAPATSGLEQKIRQQAQYIEALISQNDAFTAKLTAANGAARHSWYQKAATASSSSSATDHQARAMPCDGWPCLTPVTMARGRFSRCR